MGSSSSPCRPGDGEHVAVTTLTDALVKTTSLHLTGGGRSHTESKKQLVTVEQCLQNVKVSEYLWKCVPTRCTAWSISSVVMPGLTIKAAISRTSRASCIIRKKKKKGKQRDTQIDCMVSKSQIEQNQSSSSAPVSGYLAHHPHAFDVVTGEDLNLRRPLQELLRFRDACVDEKQDGPPSFTQ